MIKKPQAYCLLLLILIAASACAAIKPADKTAILRSELAKWENFSSEGLVEASHQGLSLRKMFVLSKTNDAARLDVLDGGAFGINPNPLVSVYLGEYFSMQSPMFPQLETWGAMLFKPGFSLGALGNPDSLISKYGDTIIENQYLEFDGTRLQFSERLQLEKITDSVSGAIIDIKYDRKGNPDTVSFRLDSDTAIDLLVDTITYGDAEVIPLPQKEMVPGLEQTLELLEQLLPLESIEQE